MEDKETKEKNNKQSRLLDDDIIDLLRNSVSNASARRIIKEYL